MIYQSTTIASHFCLLIKDLLIISLCLVSAHLININTSSHSTGVQTFQGKGNMTTQPRPLNSSCDRGGVSETNDRPSGRSPDGRRHNPLPEKGCYLKPVAHQMENSGMRMSGTDPVILKACDLWREISRHMTSALSSRTRQLSTDLRCSAM